MHAVLYRFLLAAVGNLGDVMTAYIIGPDLSTAEFWAFRNRQQFVFVTRASQLKELRYGSEIIVLEHWEQDKTDSEIERIVDMIKKRSLNPRMVQPLHPHNDGLDSMRAKP